MHLILKFGNSFVKSGFNTAYPFFADTVPDYLLICISLNKYRIGGKKELFMMGVKPGQKPF